MLCILLLASPLNLMVNLMLAAAQSVWVVTPTAYLAGAMVTISSRLQSLVGDSPTFSPDDKCIMVGRLTHTFGFMSLFAVYTPTDPCKLDEEVFYAKFTSVADRCPWLYVCWPLWHGG